MIEVASQYNEYGTLNFRDTHNDQFLFTVWIDFNVSGTLWHEELIRSFQFRPR